ncbi:unnamed protein product [Leuciscus chuanchicus]
MRSWMLLLICGLLGFAPLPPQQILPPQRWGQSHSCLAQTPLIALTEQGAAKDRVKGTLGRTHSKRLEREEVCATDNRTPGLTGLESGGIT